MSSDLLLVKQQQSGQSFRADRTEIKDDFLTVSEQLPNDLT